MLALLPLLSWLAMAKADTLFPEYRLVAAKKFSTSLGADIAASSFVDVDGQYRFIRSATTYADHDTGSFTDTYAVDDFGKLSADANSGVRTHYDAYWNLPGSMCYQLDKRAVRPMPSLHQDDHCDIVGVYIEPQTNAWYGVVNDEYQFLPLDTSNRSQNERIKSGQHNNRILLSKSTDKGKTWEIIDSLVTDYYQPDQTITLALFPGKTYSWGLSGARIYVDHIGGYVYALYNHQIRNKSGDATILAAYNVARARLSEVGTPEAWTKFYNGNWGEKAKGGRDGVVGEPLGLNLDYEPKTDYIAYTGTGADGSKVEFKWTPFVSDVWSFKDPSGVEYTINHAANTFNRNDTGAQVNTVTYHDPALDRTITVTKGDKETAFNTTDKYGVHWAFSPGKASGVFVDTQTKRLYAVPNTMAETAFWYNTYSGKYRATGYDNFVYENDDLGRPNEWVPVGHNPASVLPHMAYVSFLDTGSLTNQNVGSHSFGIVSDLYVTRDLLAPTKPLASQTSYSTYNPAVDSSNQAITANSTYTLTLGSSPLKLSNSTSWQFEDILDADFDNEVTGFYRLKDVATGKYLQIAGSTPTAKRAVGSKAILGDAQPLYDPAGNNNQGSPGGSDQWYLLPFTDAASGNVKKNRKGYKLVNRNSAFPLVPNNGEFTLAVADWAESAAQAIEVVRV